MLEPTMPGWKVETIGDDIAWMKFGDDGGCTRSTRSTGSSVSRRGPRYETNPNAMRTLDRATRSSPTWRSPMTATSGGRA
jgi:GTP-dependent phosphoenolpyruvate carboxykinase